METLIETGKLRLSDHLCAEEGCTNRLYEFTVPGLSDPLVANPTRHTPFGYICQDCDNKQTRTLIRKAARHG